MGGMTGVTGFPDSPPIKCGVSVADFSGGLYMTIAILGALHHRQNTGEGQRIDISLQDCIWHLTSIEYSPPYFLTGHILPKLGNGHPAMAPGNLYMAKDGPVLISTGVLAQVHRLYRIMGREDLIDTPMGENQKVRIKYKDQIDAAVGAWTITKTVAEIVKELQAADIVCSPVPSFDQVCNDQHLLSREMIIEVEQPVSGKVKVPGSLFKLSKTPGDVKHPAPMVGEHNLEIYSGMLGYTEEEVNQLSMEGLI
jgi:CoA:oxalate CoA-transferase